MTTAFTPPAMKLISAKAASDIVPYSRDYIARIAREGKIQAVQIDRQWFVELTSLQNFYEQSLIEESVRKRHLSQKRKLELEVKENYKTRLDQLQQKRSAGPVQAVALAVLFVLGGVSSGFLFLNGNSGSYVANVLGSEVGTISPDVPSAFVQKNVVVGFSDRSNVEETTRPLSLRGGIVLLPTETQNPHADVKDLFSDEVVVTETSSSSSVMLVDQNGVKTTMSFVRIPESSRAKIVTPAGMHEDAP